MKNKLYTIILAVIIAVCCAFGLSACAGGEHGGNEQDKLPDKLWGEVYTMDAAYAQATALGYSGTLQDFIDSITGKDGTDGKDGADGVGILSVTVNVKGELVIQLTDGKETNLGGIPHCVHDYSEWSMGMVATCTSIGYNTRSCKKCGVVDYKFTQAYGHTPKATAKAADAYSHWFECDRCGQFVWMAHTFTESGKCSVCDYKETASVPITVLFDKSVMSLEEGEVGKLTVSVTGSEEPPTVTSSNPTIAFATISGKEVTVTAVAAGTADITVIIGDRSAKCKVTVTESAIPVTVSLDKSVMSLEVGQTGTLIATVTGIEAIPRVTSGNPNIATAAISGNEITVTAISKGTTYVALIVAGFSCEYLAECEVTVTGSADELELSYNGNEVTYVMLEDSYVQNNATDDLTTMKVTVAYGGDETVTATVSDTTVATAAYSNGKVTLTAVGTGKTTLTVSAGDETKTCTVEVATFGLVYSYCFDGETDNDYMEVSGSELLTAENVYIPGYAYYAEYDQYFPVTRMKMPEMSNGVSIVDGWAFQAKTEDGEDKEGLPIVTVYTGDNVGVIAPGAFRNCYNLTAVKFGPALTRIDTYAFDRCTSLGTIDWGESQVKIINRVAFYFCAFEEIDLPATVDFIGDSAFAGCTKLKKAKINGPVTTLYGGIFMQCMVLEEVWLPAELESIANLVFYMPDVDNGWSEIDVTWNTTVHFAGKRTAWEKLRKDANSNGNVNTFLNPAHNPNLIVICADD